MNTRMHLVGMLLIIGCGGDSFATDEHEAASDGGLGGKPAVGVTSDDASVAPDGAPFVGGSGGVAGLDGSGASDSGGSPDAGGSSGSDGGVTCTTGEKGCEGRQPQVCVSGIWLRDGSECTYTTTHCLNGACVACEPGSESCTSNGTNGANWPQTCDATGSQVVADTECFGCDAPVPWGRVHDLCGRPGTSSVHRPIRLLCRTR